MLFLLGCETSTLTAAGAGTAKWIYLLFQSLPFPTGSLCWISKSTDQLMRSERHLQKWQKNISWCRNQSSVGRLRRKIFFVLASKLVSGCSSGTQLLSWGSAGALLQPPYVGLPMKTNCRGGTGHSHTSPCTGSGHSQRIKDTSKGWCKPLQVWEEHQTVKWNNAAEKWSYETPSWKQRVYLCRRNMYSCGIY